MALPSALTISTQFDLRLFAAEVINISDITDYVAEGIVTADVTGYLKIQAPNGIVFYDNWDGITPDIDQSVSQDAGAISMYKTASIKTLNGIYRVYYKATDGVDTWEKTFDLDFTYEQPYSGFVMTLDGYASTGKTEDLTDYTGLTVLSRTHTFIYPPGSGEADVVTSSTVINIDPLWAGINTATLLVQLEYTEVSGIHVLDTINAALMEWAFNVGNYNVMQMAEDFTEEFQGHLGENISAADIQRADVNVMSSYLGLYELALLEKNTLKSYEYAVEVLLITSRNGITPPVEVIPEFIFPGGGGVSPLTTKGDIYTYTTQDARFGIGLDGQVLIANSAYSTGLEWVDFPVSGVTDHGALTGLGDDDHSQYHNDARGDARYYTQTYIDANFALITSLITDHGALTGLGDDDHSQYHNDARGDARYYTQTNLQTPSQADVHWDNITNVPALGVSDHGALTGLGDDDHTQYTQRSDWGQNGFENRTDSTIGFVDGTRTFTITPVGSFSYFMNGVKYTKSSQESIVISDTEGVHMIYYNGATLTEVATPSESVADTIIRTMALVCILYWDAANNEAIYIGEERHGASMSPTTHAYLHYTEGLRYLNGLALNTMDVGGSGDDDSSAQFGVDSGAVTDEDLYQFISPISSTTGLPVYYLSGVSQYTRREYNSGFATLLQGGSIAWNEDNGGTWQLTAVGNNDYVLYHIFATTEKDEPIISVVGQNEYATAGQARDGALLEVHTLVRGQLLFPETKPIATIILQANTSYDNGAKARIVQDDDGNDYVDWRDDAITRTALPAGTSHSDLSGLASDDHQQYALLTGRLGDTYAVDNISEFTTDAGITFDNQVYVTTLEETDADGSLYYNSSTGKITFGDTLIRKGSYLNIPVTVTTPAEHTIGDITEDTAIEIHYTLQRGSIMKKGVVEVMNINGVDDPLVHDEGFGTADAGVTFDATLSTDDIVLEITVDNSSTNTVDMYYTSIKIKGTVDTASPSPPAAPTGVVGVNYDVQTYIIWTANTEPTLVGYNIYRSTTSGSGYIKINTSIIPDGTEEYIDTTVEGNISYYYVITAVTDSPQESPYSTEEYIDRWDSLVGFGADSRFAYADIGTDPIVVYVDTTSSATSNSDATHGSFSWAVGLSVPRIILFLTSGTIDYRGVRTTLNFGGGYCRIVGQSAPSPGIEVLGVNTSTAGYSDLLLQHYTSGLGDVGYEGDVMTCHGDNVVLDRMDARWGTDENVSGHPSDTTSYMHTYSRCMIYEPLMNHSYKTKDAFGHPYLSLSWSAQTTYAYNIMAFGTERFPNITYPISSPHSKFTLINNYTIGGWERTGADVGTAGFESDIVFVGNDSRRMNNDYTSGYQDYGLMVRPYATSAMSLYVSDIGCKRKDDGFSDAECVRDASSSWAITDLAETPPFSIGEYNIMSSSSVKDFLLGRAGSKWRDEHALRNIDDIENFNNRPFSLEGNDNHSSLVSGILNSPLDLPARAVDWNNYDGGFPSFTSNEVSFTGNTISETESGMDFRQFSIGHYIVITGSTSNNVTRTITNTSYDSATGNSTITVDGATLTNEAEGSTITIVAGFDWSTTNQSFTINATSDGTNTGNVVVTLNADCVNFTAALAHVNARLVAAGVDGEVEAYNPGSDSVYIGLRTLSTGSGEEIIISSSTATAIGLINATYTGEETGGHIAREENTHVLTPPANPHDVWSTGIITNLEKWIVDMFNVDPVDVPGTAINPNLVPNGGGDDTTDWVDTDTNGVADSWQVAATGTYTASIVTGNGFVGNAQRLVYTDAPGSYAFLSCTLSGLTISETYDIDFKARGSVSIRANIDGATTVATALATSGNPNSASGSFTATGTSHILRFYFTPTTPGTGDWMEIDEVNFRLQ